jgi:SAM-dependent methyltransferase
MKAARFAAASLAILLAAQAADRQMPFRVARPILEALPERPAELSVLDENHWKAWLRQETASIRTRLNQGEVDSLIHMLLFGTSFTKQARIEFATLAEASRSGLLRARVDDLLRGLAAPGANERLTFLRTVLQRNGLDAAADDGKAGVFLYENLQRLLRENTGFAQRAGQGSEFRDRGVSLDATLFPNFGIEQTLRHLRERGILRAGGVDRSAVAGPGLDFADKDSGYDYYPQQTLQPFALYDSLSKLELGGPGRPQVTVFDISSRVLDHLRRAAAAKGRAYTIQLTHDPQSAWTPEMATYWQKFGERIGKPVAPIEPPAALAALETRALEVRPEVVRAVLPASLNVVLDHATPPPAERFDLIVATNLFVYYNRLEQALALQNLSALLKPGGILISNDELPILPPIPVRRLGAVAVMYTATLGDSMVYYQRQ